MTIARRHALGLETTALIYGVAALWPITCLAYIDPNAGGWLFQSLFPVYVAIAAAWLMFRSHAVRVVRQWVKRTRRDR